MPGLQLKGVSERAEVVVMVATARSLERKEKQQLINLHELIESIGVLE